MTNDYLKYVTPAEKERFLIANDGDESRTEAALQSYIEYRQKKELPCPKLEPTTTSSTIDTYCTASTTGNIEPRDLPTTLPGLAEHTGAQDTELPMHPTLGLDLPDCYLLGLKGPDGGEILCPDGKRCLLLFAAMIDTSLGTTSEYAEAICRHQDQFMPRESPEQYTLYIDTRAGKSWANPSAWSLCGLGTELAGLMSGIFPERLAGVHVFPVPWLTLAVWHFVKPFIPAKTVEKFKLHRGEDVSVSGKTPDAFPDYIVEAIERLKRERDGY